VTTQERLLVRALRDLVADDDGALEVLDSLDDDTREFLSGMAMMEVTE
jgi:hypothetical protein